MMRAKAAGPRETGTLSEWRPRHHGPPWAARKSSVPMNAARAVSGQTEYGAPLGIYVAEEDRPTPFRPLALR